MISQSQVSQAQNECQINQSEPAQPTLQQLQQNLPESGQQVMTPLPMSGRPTLPMYQQQQFAPNSNNQQILQYTAISKFSNGESLQSYFNPALQYSQYPQFLADRNHPYFVQNQQNKFAPGIQQMTGVIGGQTFPPSIFRQPLNANPFANHQDVLRKYNSSSFQMPQSFPYMQPYFMAPQYQPFNTPQMVPSSQQSYSGQYSQREKSTSSAKADCGDMEISEFLTRSRRKELEQMLSKTHDLSEVLVKSKQKKKISKSSRGSKFRGVSKNGKKWQVQLLGNLKKHYIGSIDSEEKAARIYDRHAILTHGLRAKTNFAYAKPAIQIILAKEHQDFIQDNSTAHDSQQNTKEVPTQQEQGIIGQLLVNTLQNQFVKLPSLQIQ